MPRFLPGLIVASALLAGCGSTPAAPTPLPLGLACPVPVTVPVKGPDGAPVTFDLPVVSGGVRPVATVCSPGSGTTFPIGESTVQCSTSDAAGASASCSFQVRVEVGERLARTMFLAFGDSITEGVVSEAAAFGLTSEWFYPESYPVKLDALLRERYPAQPEIHVANYGHAGETLPEGRERLPDVLDQVRPEVLLLLEGVNQIRQFETHELSADLEAMVKEARDRGIEVMLATLLPTGPARQARPAGPDELERIQRLNAEIARLADRYALGAPVDVYGLFSRSPSLLGADGLHPTEAGYAEMARVFLEAIVARYGMGP